MVRAMIHRPDCSGRHAARFALMLAPLMIAAPALAGTPPPQLLLPPDRAIPAPVVKIPQPTPTMSVSPVPEISAVPLIQPSPMIQPTGPVPVEEPVMAWTLPDAQALLRMIMVMDQEGLIPADYEPDALLSAIQAGAGPALDAQASRSFDWLAEDLRDGRTPMKARLQWFAVDPDSDAAPTAMLLTRALATHDIGGVLARLDPTYPDYAALRQALALTAPEDEKARAAIRINMDRWRWLPRDLGDIYLLANVPEFQLRLMRGDRMVRSYRTVVGKPGRTATPQLAEKVQAVVFNPTWTVPQSIIEHENLGEKLLADPAKARRQGYKVTEHDDGSVTIVQQPGNNNSLGRMKIDMPNPHAIYLHDTPSKALFAAPVRAYSHGCIRTENAVQLGMTMAMLGANMQVDQAVALADGGKYSRVPMTRTFPVYITYFTQGRGLDGQVTGFADIYGRDAPVLASFAGARELHTTQRSSDQEVIVASDPL